jgi:hypothetical protein
LACKPRFVGVSKDPWSVFEYVVPPSEIKYIIDLFKKNYNVHQCIGVALHSKMKIPGLRSAPLDLKSPEGPISVDDYERYLEMVMVDFCVPLNKQFTCQINSLQKLCAEKLVVMASNSETHPSGIIGKFNKMVYNCSHVKRLSHEILGWPRQYLLENQKKSINLLWRIISIWQNIVDCKTMIHNYKLVCIEILGRGWLSRPLFFK